MIRVKLNNLLQHVQKKGVKKKMLNESISERNLCAKKKRGRESKWGFNSNGT